MAAFGRAEDFLLAAEPSPRLLAIRAWRARRREEFVAAFALIPAIQAVPDPVDDIARPGPR